MGYVYPKWHTITIKNAQQTGQLDREKRGGATREIHWRGKLPVALSRYNQ